MNELLQQIMKADTISIAGHIRPDGDCVGSCTALYNYIQKNYNNNGTKHINVYMLNIPNEFLFLKGTEDFTEECKELENTELFIALDSGSIDRLGEAEDAFKKAKHTVCIDHHISNTSYADTTILRADASSTCEILFDLFDINQIDLDIANSLYLGIIHDTGVFKHSNTKKHTMEVAGCLLEKGVLSETIIDSTFYEKTYLQNQILGRCLMESILLLDGKIIVSSISKRVQEFYGTNQSDYSGIIDSLRVTKGVEVAILLVETGTMEYKVSMRSNGIVNVSKIAVFFEGGGHIKAAGCTMVGELHDVINNLTAGIENQLMKAMQDKRNLQP